MGTALTRTAVTAACGGAVTNPAPAVTKPAQTWGRAARRIGSEGGGSAPTRAGVRGVAVAESPWPFETGSSRRAIGRTR
jgi:hypothetical protein